MKNITQQISGLSAEFALLYVLTRGYNMGEQRKNYCPEADCQGAPGCPCMKPEYWERWEFDQIHNKRELFDLARDLLQELQVCRKFIGSRERIHRDGLAMLDELISNGSAVIERKYDA